MITTANYYDSTKNIDWNAVPASLKKTHETLIPDAAKGDWKTYNADEDVRRVVEKYFGYIGRYATVPSVATNSKKGNSKLAAKPSDRTGEKQARDVAIALIRPYVLRGDSLESIRKSWLGSSGGGGSAQVKGNKIIVDKVGGDAVNFSFSLLTLFKEIKGPTADASQKQSKKGKVKDVSSLPEPAQVVFIPTATAFIKRYATLHGKVKSRDQILSLTHGLQKAITEQRIKNGSPAYREIEKMQKELIALAKTMADSVKIEIDAPSLAHYKQIARGEEVRSSVKLLKSFIAMTGKAYDKTKAASLLKRMETASGVIPKEDAYRTQLITAIEELSVYVQGKEKTVGIPSAGLHGLGAIATGHSVNGLGIIAPGSGEGAIIRLLRAEGVKSLSDSALKKAFRGTVVPGLCLEIARSLIRRGELSMAILNEPPKKKSYWEGGSSPRGLGDAEAAASSGRITDLDILEMRLQNHEQSAAGISGLGNADDSVPASRPRNQPEKTTPVQPESKAATGQIMSAEALRTMKFETIGLTGKWKALIGDPAPGFSAMVYGLPKQGKSTFCLQLANDLAKYGQVLYCALEEGFGATLSEKLHRLGISANALQFSNQIPQDLSRYKFVFIDSVSEAGMDAEGLRELRKANPNTAFIFVYHSTKAGNFRGSNTDAHDVDVIIEVKNGVAYAKGRYAPPAEVKI